MSSSEAVKSLEEQLEEAGNKLLQPPSSLDDLLPLLDQIENSLSKVEQSPAKSTHTALSPLMKALVADELLRHPDIDVKVAVASCISEITRITAPDAPYDDDKMKDVFQLIVSAFENLADKSSRSYNKRALILETVAKVRSCVIMLDLECDELIIEMFQIFFRTIRDYHPDSIFSSMETIMSLVLDESEDISTELLTILLSSVKRDNEEVSPIARRLGERVFENCEIKLKPYLGQAMKSLDISLDDYSKILTSVCEGTIGQNNDNASKEEQLGEGSKPATASSDETAQGAKDVVEGACREDADPAANRSPNSTMSNGISETRKEGTSVQLESLEKGEHLDTDKTTNDEVTPKPESDDSGAEKSTISESKLEETARERGRKINSSTKSTESSDPSRVDGEKESEKLLDNKESHEKDSDSSAGGDTCLEEAKHLEKEKDISDGEAHEGANVASSSPSEGVADESLPEKGGRPKKKESLVQEETPSQGANVASPSPSEGVADESHPKKGGRPKKKESLVQEETQSPEVVAKKASERTSDSEAKPQRRSGKKAPREITNKDQTSGEVGTSKNEDGTTSDSEAKPLKQLGKKLDASDNDEDGSSIKKKEDMKKRGRGKASTEKHTTKSSTKDDVKEVVSSPKSPAKSTKEEDHVDEIRIKRKRTPGKEKASETMEYGKNLVGSKVKVWWPRDRMFYEGVIDSFDPIKKKHKVLYNDGDQEILNLRKERWEFIGGDAATDTEDEPEPASIDASSDMQKTKKAKRSACSSVKHEPDEVLPKRKLKGTATKSGKKSKDEGKTDSKSRDGTSKSGGNSDDETGNKSKAHSQKSSGKSVNDSPKPSGKSKDLDSNTSKSKSKQETVKTASKSKDDNPKNAVKSKGKTPQSGEKSSANGVDKVKSSSSKVKDGGDVKEKTNDLAKTPEGSKRKLSDSSKDRESETKSSKKRQRSVKG